MSERALGKYRLLSQLAVGGMAEIYVAKTSGVGGFEKLVALKVIHPNYSEDPEFVQMLVDEAKLAVQLQHANIVQTFDLGCVDEQYYIAMELIDGVDLYKLLRRASEKDLDFPFEVAAFIAQETCNGLDFAHRKRDSQGRPLNIVHRDISPQNILVSYDGEVKIVDFGIAKASMRKQQTAAGVIKGKYYYMSPEQAWGDPIDTRTDVFSAGILLYEMLVGQMLYLEEDMDLLLDKVRKANIAPPSSTRKGVPPELEAIVMHALKKRAMDRFQTAGAFGVELSGFLRTQAPGWNRGQLAAFVQQVLGDEPTNKTRDPDGAAALLGDFERDENSLLLKLAGMSGSPAASPSPVVEPAPARTTGKPLPSKPEAKQALGRLQPVRAPAPPAPRQRDMMTSPVDLAQVGIGVAPNDYEETDATIVDGASDTLMVSSPRDRSEPTNSVAVPAARRPLRRSQPAIPVAAERPAARAEDPAGDDEADYTAVDPFSKDSVPTDPIAMPKRRAAKPDADAEPRPLPGVRSELQGDASGRAYNTDDEDTGPAGGEALNFDEEDETTRMKAKARADQARAAAPAASLAAAPTGPSAASRSPAGNAPSPRPAASPSPARPAAPSPSPARPAAASPSPARSPAAASPSPARPPAAASPSPSRPAPAPAPRANTPSGPRPITPANATPLPVAQPTVPRSSSAPRPTPLDSRLQSDPRLVRLLSARSRFWLVVGAALASAGVVAGVIVLSAGPVKASIEVVSSPGGADVKLDGTLLSQKTPLEIVEVDPKRPHHVIIALRGHEPWETEVKFDNRAGQVRVQAVLTPMVGTLELTSTPPGAEAIVNGRIRGVTPTVVNELSPLDDVAIELRLRGYRAAHKTLSWPAPSPATPSTHHLSESILLEKSR